jgi:hypothetical protein
MDIAGFPSYSMSFVIEMLHHPSMPFVIETLHNAPPPPPPPLVFVDAFDSLPPLAVFDDDEAVYVPPLTLFDDDDDLPPLLRDIEEMAGG